MDAKASRDPFACCEQLQDPRMDRRFLAMASRYAALMSLASALILAPEARSFRQNGSRASAPLPSPMDTTALLPRSSTTVR